MRAIVKLADVEIEGKVYRCYAMSLPHRTLDHTHTDVHTRPRTTCPAGACRLSRVISQVHSPLAPHRTTPLTHTYTHTHAHTSQAMHEIKDMLSTLVASTDAWGTPAGSAASTPFTSAANTPYTSATNTPLGTPAVSPTSTPKASPKLLPVTEKPQKHVQAMVLEV